MSTSPAPIALFVYNRPDHVLRTISALQANPLARKSPLYVFSDGPNGSQDIAAVQAVRRIVKSVTGFDEIVVRHQPKNLGLAQSIIAGVTELSAAYGHVIVLEDDLVVAPGFLTFMNQALQRYEHEPRVMQVSGYMFPVERPKRLGQTFFCRVPTSWGWATWARAWERLSLDSTQMLESLRSPERREAFNLNGAYPYFEHLIQQAEGKLDVWGVRWYASMFTAGGLCLYPGQSLVQNIGMDGTGMHCGRSSDFDVELSVCETWKLPDRVQESAPAFEAIRSFLIGLRAQKRTGAIVDLVSRLRHAAGRMKRAITSAG
ncbi:MAG TPA: glycosyltransferase [Nitrospira sp.]|nr:glycosyltransferase [Nitrospira sp.]